MSDGQCLTRYKFDKDSGYLVIDPDFTVARTTCLIDTDFK